MCRGLMVLRQYFNLMHVFSYDVNDKRQRRKKKNERRLERAVEKANSFFFPATKTPSASVVTITSSASSRSGRNPSMPVDIISLHIEEPQERRQGPIVRAPRDLRAILSVQLPLLVCAAFSAALHVSISSTWPSTGEEWAQRKEQQKRFEDIAPDAYPTDFRLYEEPPP